MAEEVWQAHAKCVGTDPELYVLDSGRGFVPPSGTRRDRRARELCTGCPVVRACAYDALLQGDTGVVRGGVWLGVPARSAARYRLLAEEAGVQ